MSKIYDFNAIIDRRGTDSLKYDFITRWGRPEDTLPLWVADMDFPAPREVLDALHSCADHGIFGYTDVKSDYYEATANWFSARFGWTPGEDWLVKTPGLVFALATAVRALTSPGDAVLIQTPVYPPFASVVEHNGRRLVRNQLLRDGNRYRIDFEDLERKFQTEQVKLFLLCSPHNPVGRVWTKEELRSLGQLCLRYGVKVFSDEIHCDFTYPGHTHRMFLEVNPELTSLALLGTAPSKTFNLAGLQAANIWIPDAGLRQAFADEMDRTGYHSLNTMGLAACKAAYRYGGQWLEQLKKYLTENLAYLRSFFREHLPELTLIEPEGTYLVWFDCAGLGLDRKERERFFREEARVWLNRGSSFGPGGEGFRRMNIACPRPVLAQALERIAEAAKARRSR